MATLILLAGLIATGILVFRVAWANQGAIWPAPPIATPPYELGPRLVALRAAIKNDWPCLIVYVDQMEKVTSRQIHPRRLDGDYLIADCDLRQDERRFRIDRIVKLDVSATRSSSREKYRVREVSSLKSVPRIDKFPSLPRQRTLSEALAQGWECRIEYLLPDETPTVAFFSQEPRVRYEPTTITYVQVKGETISINRISAIEVNASDEKIRMQYRVTPDTVQVGMSNDKNRLTAFGVVATLLSFVCIYYFLGSPHTGQPERISADAAPLAIDDMNRSVQSVSAHTVPAQSSVTVKSVPSSRRMMTDAASVERIAPQRRELRTATPSVSGPELAVSGSERPAPSEQAKAGAQDEKPKGRMVCVARRGGGETCHYEEPDAIGTSTD